MKKLYFISFCVLVVWSCESNYPNSILNSNADAPTYLAKKALSATVMTWNIYVGTDIGKVLSASSPQEVPLLAAQAFQLLLANNFYERADAIADQISTYEPDLIGLQEVALWRIQSPGDAVIGGTVPAEDVLFDYLQILLDAIKSRDMNYYVAGMVENIDGELPMLTSATPTFDDIRLTDYNVVLVREDVKISNVQEVNLATALEGEFGKIKRGYVSLDAMVGYKKFHFVTTHLESGDLAQPVRLAQADELITALAKETKPVIVAGDLNSRLPDATCQLFVNSGYQDIWPINELQNNPDGFTAYHSKDLLDSEPLNRRIDHIMIDPRAEAEIEIKAELVGDEEQDKTVNSLWPSDHAGVVAELKLK